MTSIPFVCSININDVMINIPFICSISINDVMIKKSKTEMTASVQLGNKSKHTRG